MFNKNKLITKSIILAGLSIMATACGSKVAGTYNMASITASGGTSGISSLYQNYCNNLSLTIASSGNNIVTASGTNGQCSESLQGTESSGMIQVSQFSISLTNMGSAQPCYYSGTLTVNNNMITGTLNSTTAATSAYSYGSYNSCATSITLSGTKVN